MPRNSLEATGHILHDISCCRKMARDLRTISIGELAADNLHLRAFKKQITDHYNFRLNQVIKFSVRSAWSDEIEAEAPSSQANILPASGYGMLVGMMVMPELVFDENEAVIDSEIPDLFLELESRTTNPVRDEDLVKLWLPVQHLEEVLFLNVSEYSRN